MLKIRLTRMGRHKSPFYRIVAIDSKTRRDGKYIQLLGTYAPLDGKIELKNDEIMHHLKNGAQPSETVKNIFKKQGIWKSFMESKNN